MTAVAWTPADYFAASRRARHAWQLTDHQLALNFGALDEPQAGEPLRFVERARLGNDGTAAFSPEGLPWGALAPGAEPCHGPYPVALAVLPAGSAPPLTSNPPRAAEPSTGSPAARG